MKLDKLRTQISEMWHFPTRVLKRVNQTTNFSNTSCLYSDVNSINPKKYFEKKKTNIHQIKEDWRKLKIHKIITEDIDKKTLKETDKGNYVIRNEIWIMEGLGDKPIKMTACYSKKDNGYIGGLKEAKFLCDEMGIIPEISKPDHNVCSIGFSPKDNKWYGWSHRAIHGFKIGDRKLELSPDISNSGAVIKNEEEAREAAIEFADSVS